ncbi:DUF115 domain-containing protein [Alteromonas sediminis]|uniref:DUF115 domain-containing protein n=1 Tax=Alteromonas sediminis TaxID=2259342 RepID=A0A3N5Y4E6_9ALTE|nr:6-hydroxymethylpterin diphosphokinase MptE-like protein [Alteromonas sediminis]RPJ64969.1 DUF115 domain-containing protein [Alteromonas sediminis]
MLKNVYLHIHSDDDEQQLIEKERVGEMTALERSNLNTLQRRMPGLYELACMDESSTSSIICNKHGELNIVDQKTGRVLYGEHPRQEISKHVDWFLEYPFRITCSDTQSGRTEAQTNRFLGFDSPIAVKLSEHDSTVSNMDIVVVLGLGLGYQLDMLIDRVNPRHIIIYEPDIGYLKSSLFAISYKALLERANKQGVGLYFQAGKDGRDIKADITELSEVTPADAFYVYKHYNHPVFDKVVKDLALEAWCDIQQIEPSESELTSFIDYVPPWTQPFYSHQWTRAGLNLALFESNLAALKRYFPDIHESMVNYSPKNWWPVSNSDGIVNLAYHPTMSLLYGENPCVESKLSIEAFKKRPNIDGLVLGYNGKKLRKYQHYQLVNKCEAVLNELEESNGDLPESVKSMIIFGLGVGYQLPHLFENHTVEKLFICEPNPDYFFASLFSISWSEVFERFDVDGGHLYINIGDDGSHLIEDLLKQFHTVGPYVLASTYFYQGYYNANLVNAIARLREQLKVIIAMGDYYDHAKYGIAHTTWSINNNIRYLTKTGINCLAEKVKRMPVILVGNGPSLDTSIEFLKSSNDKALIVSCGTSLQTLYKWGIKPDFHAEIEQNRSTYEWATKIDGFEYLKDITLISCNGIHPDTCRLYKQTFLALKEGEASTVFYTEMFPDHDFEILTKAFPTVTNLASDIVNKIGFQSIYLVGIDLGFVDDKYHHSKASAYYDDDGEEMYEYAKENDVTLLVEGNIRPFVYTKYEFKIAQAMLEQTFTNQNSVYNLSDGVKFSFASTLAYKDVLFDKFEGSKEVLFEELCSSCFAEANKSEFNEKKEKRFSHASLLEELEALSHLLEITTFDTKCSVMEFVDKHRDLLVKSYQRKKSFLFFYLNGTVNFVNSALSKVVNVDNDWLMPATEIIRLWKDSLKKITYQLTHDEMSFDFVSAHTVDRRNIVAKRNFMICPKKIKMASSKYEPLLNTSLSYFGLDPDATIGANEEYLIRFSEQCDVSSYSRICTIHQRSEKIDLECIAKNESLVVLPGNYLDTGTVSAANDYVRIRCAIFALFSSKKIKVVFPKLPLDSKTQSITDYYNLDLVSHCFAYELEHCVLFSIEPLPEEEKLTLAGDRLKLIPLIAERDLIYCELPYEQQLDEKDYYSNILAR